MVEVETPTSAEQDVGSSESALSNEDVVSLSARLSEELVFALVAPIGSGASTSANILKNTIERKYGYACDLVRISALINRYISEDEQHTPIRDDDPNRIQLLQAAGNRLREKHGNMALARLAIAKIHSGRPNGAVRRHCTVVDALKHPEEAALLRSVYGEAFWLIGIFAPEDVRIARLENSANTKSYVESIKSTDTDEGHTYGQSVRKTIVEADVFIRNDRENTEFLERSVERFLRLVFGEPVETPTQHETAMFHAAGAGKRSACLSRQVGAVIVNKKGELIGQGANDVPKAGGGLYNSDDGADDHRCFKWRFKHCWNDHHKERIFNQIASLEGGSAIASKAVREKTDVKNLIDFSRAVHAEMEAIISVARQSNAGIVGSILYTTTFPCHNCARHIVASGVAKVFYIEPYPKSLAITLHSDAIETVDGDERKVRFLQYEGIAPQSFNRVFGFRSKRKQSGKVIDINPTTAMPLSASVIDSLHTREEIVLENFLKCQREDAQDGVEIVKENDNSVSKSA